MDMKRRWMMLLLSGMAAVMMTGCGGGGGDTVVVDEGPIPETFFITDGFGNGVSGIIYHCDSGFSGVTNFEGAFTFDIAGDNCNFDLLTNGITEDLFLEYDNDPNTDAGINGIYFECFVGGSLVASDYTRYDPLFGVNGFIEEGSLYDGCTLFDIH